MLFSALTFYLSAQNHENKTENVQSEQNIQEQNEKKANVSSRKKVDWESVLITSNGEELKELISKNSKFKKIKFGENDENGLLFGIRSGLDADSIKMILSSGISASDSNKQKQNALFYAAMYSHENPDITRLLVNSFKKQKDLDAALNEKDADGKIPFDYAVDSQNITFLEEIRPLLSESQLQALDILIDQKNQEEQKKQELLAKIQAEEEEKRKAEEEKLKAQEEVEAMALATKAQESGENPPEEEFKKMFLYDYQTEETEDSVPEQQPIEEDYTLSEIPEPNTRDENGVTYLMKAAKNGNDWELRSLLKSGADVNLSDNEGWTALMYAVRYQNNLEIVRLLIEKGADIKASNRFGNTPLQLASCYSGNPEILKKIVQVYPSGSTELFKAFILNLSAGTGSTQTQLAKLQVFIDSCVPLNKFYQEKTPLMTACSYASDTKIIQLLIESGAIINLRDKNGETAFDYASRNMKLQHDDIYWSLNK